MTITDVTRRLVELLPHFNPRNLVFDRLHAFELGVAKHVIDEVFSIFLTGETLTIFLARVDVISAILPSECRVSSKIYGNNSKPVNATGRDYSNLARYYLPEALWNVNVQKSESQTHVFFQLFRLATDLQAVALLIGAPGDHFVKPNNSAWESDFEARCDVLFASVKNLNLSINNLSVTVRPHVSEAIAIKLDAASKLTHVNHRLLHIADSLRHFKTTQVIHTHAGKCWCVMFASSLF